MTKSYFLLPLALCLVFQQHYNAAADNMVEKATKETLIKTACSATTSPPLCSSALSSVANNPHLDPTSITITAAQAATKTAVATFNIINMSLTVDVQLLSDPAVRQSLTICADAYKQVIENMDKATSSLTQKANANQAPNFLNAAMASVARCDASGIKLTNKVVHIAAKNIDVSKLIKNALDIYQVFATYIINPTHDPKMGPAPLPPVPNVGGNIAGGGGMPIGGGAGAQIAGGVQGLIKGGGIAGASGGAPANGGGIAGPLGGGQGIGGIAGAFKGGSAGAPADAGGSVGAPAGGIGGNIAGPLKAGGAGANGGALGFGGIAGVLKGGSPGASANGGGTAGAPTNAGAGAGASGGGIAGGLLNAGGGAAGAPTNAGGGAAGAPINAGGGGGASGGGIAGGLLNAGGSAGASGGSV